jgi:SsrA-binding protein
MSRTVLGGPRPPDRGSRAGDRAQKSADRIEPVADNRKAGFDYLFLDQFEAGIALLGTEVKAIREGMVNLRDSYVGMDRGEAWLFKMHIGQYSHSGSAAHDPGRKRKLLLNATELRNLIGKTKEKGLTIVPTKLYFKNGRLKVGIALAKGKKAHDKRETMKKRDADRETRAAVKSRVR